MGYIGMAVLHDAGKFIFFQEELDRKLVINQFKPQLVGSIPAPITYSK